MAARRWRGTCNRLLVGESIGVGPAVVGDAAECPHLDVQALAAWYSPRCSCSGSLCTQCRQTTLRVLHYPRLPRCKNWGTNSMGVPPQQQNGGITLGPAGGTALIVGRRRMHSKQPLPATRLVSLNP